MDKQKVLCVLLRDLQSFLLLLDSENLSYIAQSQKKSISTLLSTLYTTQSTLEDTEYMVMTCPSSSPVEITAGPDVLWSSELVSRLDLTLNQTSVAPPLPIDEAYEESAPYAPQTTSKNTEGAGSDSSHYESYGEDDDDDDEGPGMMMDRHLSQWSASQPCLRPAPESRLCGYLWRRRWLGQWSKQLFIIRNHSLMCYKCSRDLLPQMDIDLRGCLLSYKSKQNQKVPHQLKLVPVGSESLVLGYSSYQHADEWRKVIEEVSCGDTETQSSSVIRTELSCRSSAVQTDSDDERPQQDTVFLNVLMNCQWQSLQCEVENGVLNMFAHKDLDQDQVQDYNRTSQDHTRNPQYTVPLRGCDIRAGPDTSHSYRITLSMPNDQLAVLEVNSAEEKQRWIKLLKNGADEDSTSLSVLSGLQTRRFPVSNSYMDPSEHQVYSNTSILQHMFQDSSKDCGTYSNSSLKKISEERSVQRLELAGKPNVQLRAGSEVNMRAGSEVNLATKNKRASFRQSLAVCTERAQVVLRRTASAKLSLSRAPSLLIESGRVFQRKKEWETKASA